LGNLVLVGYEVYAVTSRACFLNGGVKLAEAHDSGPRCRCSIAAGKNWVEDGGGTKVESEEMERV
jgi:hypothetical protein